MLKRKRVLSLTLIFCLALPLTVFGSSPGQAENGAYFLDTVLQKSYIAVDEKGTEAAAVTAVMGAGGWPQCVVSIPTRTGF